MPSIADCCRVESSFSSPNPRHPMRSEKVCTLHADTTEGQERFARFCAPAISQTTRVRTRARGGGGAEDAPSDVGGSTHPFVSDESDNARASCVFGSARRVDP